MGNCKKNSGFNPNPGRRAKIVLPQKKEKKRKEKKTEKKERRKERKKESKKVRKKGSKGRIDVFVDCFVGKSVEVVLVALASSKHKKTKCYEGEKLQPTKQKSQKMRDLSNSAQRG